MTMRRPDHLLLAGLLLLTGAVGLAATYAYAESATLCGSVLDRGLPDAERSGFCDMQVDGRRTAATVLAVLAVLALGAALGLRRTGTAEEPARPPVWLPLLGLLVPLLTVVGRLVLTAVVGADGADYGDGVPEALFLVPGGLAVWLVLALAARAGLGRATALAVGAVSLPLVWLTQLLSAFSPGGFDDDALARRVDGRLVTDQLGDVWTYDKQLFLGALVVAAALALPLVLRRSPSVGASWALLAVGAVVTTVVLHLGLLPGTGLPSDAVLGLLVAVPAVVALAVWAVGTRDREPVRVS